MVQRLLEHENTRPGLIITAVTGVLLLVHLALRFRYGDLKDGLDAVTLGLTIVALAPWIAKVLESFKFGGVEFKFVKQQIAEQRREMNVLNFLVANLVLNLKLNIYRSLHQQILLLSTQHITQKIFNES